MLHCSNCPQTENTHFIFQNFCNTISSKFSNCHLLQTRKFGQILIVSRACIFLRRMAGEHFPQRVELFFCLRYGRSVRTGKKLLLLRRMRSSQPISAQHEGSIRDKSQRLQINCTCLIPLTSPPHAPPPPALSPQINMIHT